MKIKNIEDKTVEVKIELLNIKEASEFFKVAESTLYQWKHYGKIPFVKIGGKLCFEKQTLINFFMGE